MNRCLYLYYCLLYCLLLCEAMKELKPIVGNAWKLFRAQHFTSDGNPSSDVSFRYSHKDNVHPAVFFHFQLNSSEHIDHVVHQIDVLRDMHPLVSIDYEILVNSVPSSPSFYQYSVLIDFVNNTFSQGLLHSFTSSVFHEETVYLDLYPYDNGLKTFLHSTYKSQCKQMMHYLSYPFVQYCSKRPVYYHGSYKQLYYELLDMIFHTSDDCHLYQPSFTPYEIIACVLPSLLILLSPIISLCKKHH